MCDGEAAGRGIEMMATGCGATDKGPTATTTAI